MDDAVYRSQATLSDANYSLSQALFITVLAVVTLLLFFIHEQTAPPEKHRVEKQVMTPLEFSDSERT